ncbi:Cof-type HAD-IIB family hydrolase [Hutsoniella sourekii]
MLEFIASDMDGTLLDQTLEIPQENIDAIMHTYQLGIPFVVCTGRNFTEAKVPLDNAGIRCPIIGLNGAIQFDREGNVEFEIPIDDQVALELIDYGTKQGFYLEAMTSKNVYSSSKNDRIKLIAKLISEQNPDLSVDEISQRATQSHEVTSIDYREDLKKLITEEQQRIVKIVYISEEGRSAFESSWKEIEQEYEDLYVTSSFFYNLEISHKDATKGQAIKRYAKDHGYSLENTLTIGDNLNDLTMLEIAGYSYAMANAEEAVKKVAKFTTASNYEGGVAKAINKTLELTGTVEEFNKK